MKQFLGKDITCNGIAVALNDRAFFCSVKGAGKLVELLPPIGECHDGAEENKIDVKKESGAIESKNDEDIIDATHIENEVGGKDSGSRNAEQISGPNQMEIQAVAVFSKKDKNHNMNSWCAVARYDKSLSVYSIPSADDEDDKTTKIKPTTVHRTNKRAGNLSFATVPSSDENIGSLPIIVAGDLAGDVVAFPLDMDSTKEEQSDNDEKKEQESNEHKFASKNKRLLLGHTASMLTSVHVVETEIPIEGKEGCAIEKKQRIITSDRDEKIRVSSFPATHVIEGFLLGHEEYISCTDYSAKSNRCVSLSGDETIRIWDFTSFDELAKASYVRKNQTGNISSEALNGTEKNGSKEDEDDDNRGSGEEEEDEEKENVKNQELSVSPSRVAMNNFGDIVVSIYDESLFMDIWKVYETGIPACDKDGQESDQSPSKKLSLKCCLRHNLEEQPLAVSFLGYGSLLVLTRDPGLLMVFRVENDSKGGLRLVDETSEYPFCAELRKIAKEEGISMPEGVLERDPVQQKFKLQKVTEKRGGARAKPWNDVGRKEVAKERNKRLKKRQRSRRRK